MLWPLTWAVIIGTLPGVFIGAWVRIEFLPDPRNFKLFVGMILLYIGFRLFMDVIKNKGQKKGSSTKHKTEEGHIVKLLESTLRQVKFDYDGETFQFSPLIVYVICFLVGIIGGIYGIGGGSIVAPFFVAIIGLPVYTVAGAALMGTFITSVAGVIFYQYLSWVYTEFAVAPDWTLGVLFGLGGLLGMYLGARTQKFVPARIIKGILCCCVLFVAVRYVVGFFT
ncbi:UPF0721 transmembrane protein [Desulfosarcina alkanivorans]|uniref:Probable membrane transporter protein n=2 Tax=Desulfosarcina alkanivorans TaxID=571177 RepID=A0A5K7YIC5_9BACT|nr:UPF0721 transmembrane protein [Desulfosarcina alkanivorans]